MHETSLKCVLRYETVSGGDWIGAQDLPFKLSGRSENYEKFLRNRCLISKKYFLSHKLMRTIVSKAAMRLPKIICNFKKYREKGYLDFME
jgi:hypothetical protein